jgi:hypothetical protein
VLDVAPLALVKDFLAEVAKGMLHLGSSLYWCILELWDSSTRSGVGLMSIWRILVLVSSRATCGDKHKFWETWMGTTVPRESSNSSDPKETVK